jgi:hypothetical protein
MIRQRHGNAVFQWRFGNVILGMEQDRSIAFKTWREGLKHRFHISVTERRKFHGELPADRRVAAGT